MLASAEGPLCLSRQWSNPELVLPGIDGGGSVRVPAALCGVAALRPTVGRTSHAHCPPNAFSIMAVGPLTGCLADALLVHAAIGNAGAPATQPGRRVLHTRRQARHQWPIRCAWHTFRDLPRITSRCSIPRSAMRKGARPLL
jgi:hypothetical protein